jgi:hypothetical protein
LNLWLAWQSLHQFLFEESVLSESCPNMQFLRHVCVVPVVEETIGLKKGKAYQCSIQNDLDNSDASVSVSASASASIDAAEYELRML